MAATELISPCSSNCGSAWTRWFLILTVCCVAVDAYAHPYLPLRPGDVTVLKYQFRVEGKKTELSPADINGQMTLKNEEEEKKQGKKYLRTSVSYRDIPYMTEAQQNWRREENGAVFLASMHQGEWVETMELAADVAVGKEWDYNDGVSSIRKVTAKTTVKLPDGKVLDDCIEVSRIILNDRGHKGVMNKVTYCKDVGEVGSIFSQPSPLGTYTTETKIESFVASGK